MRLSVKGLSEMSVRGRGEADDLLERSIENDQPRTIFPLDGPSPDAV
jgi:hypothetical protein